jgi:chromosome segregation ATPase
MIKDEGSEILDKEGKPISKEAEINIRLKSENEDLSLSINSKKLDIEGLNQQIKDLQKTLDQSIDKNNQVVSDTDKKNKEKDVIIKAIASNKESFSFYEEKLNNLKFSVEAVQKDLDKLNSDYSKKEADLSKNLESLQNDADEKLKEVSFKVADAEKKLNIVNNSIEDMTKMNNGIKQSNAQLVLEGKELQKDANDLTEVNQHLKDENNKLQNEIEGFSNQLKSLQEIINAGNKTVREIQEEIEKINSDKEKALQELGAVMVKIKNINDKEEYNNSNFDYIKEQGERCGIIISPFAPGA